MSQITITLPDGSQRDYPTGTTGLEVAESISSGLARNALAIEANGEVLDLARPLSSDAEAAILTWNDEGGKHAFWHSSAHLFAEALEALYPGAHFGIGPAIKEGFYYDVDLSNATAPDGTSSPTLSPDDLPALEKKMIELARQNNSYERRDVGKDDAIAFFEQKGDPYKLELLEGLEDGTISFYTQGNFTDLCRGPHIPATKPIKAVKLTALAGAYWRGDESRPQMTRIYGITFPKQKELDEHLERIELAKQRDHRKLGRELELFMFSNKVGPGLPIWLPKGARLRETLVDFLKEEQLRRGYQPVVTPHIGRLDLFRTSGHYPYYSDSQFPPMLEGQSSPAIPHGENPDDRTHDETSDASQTSGEEQGYLLKPMNCPHHTQIYDYKPHSYRDLPVRLAEFGTVYRYEQSGELGGLTRVRGFTQDDAHVFCTPDQVKAEFKDAIDLTMVVLKSMGFKEYTAQVSLRDPANTTKYIGGDAQWDAAEQAIREAATEMGLDTVEEEGEAAFYGPKLDFMVTDALGRSWQLGTVQVDYNLPERFDLTYTGEDGQKHRPVMIHRAPFGSLERFIGVLIEHCGGHFPVWLAPTQVTVLPVSDAFNDYATHVYQTLRDAGFRAEADTRSEKIGYKIRQAEVGKIPYMLVVGGKEVENGTVAVRRQGQGEQHVVSVEDFATSLAEEVARERRGESAASGA